jgi:GT2 family glycosyltransferase
MERIELSIITVNYNGAKDTGELIESLRDNLSIPYELIVVDNGSKKNEAVLLQERYPFIKAIRSDNNLGFAGGNNIGIKEAIGNYLFFLNNDTFVLDDSISRLLDAIKQDPLLGGISPKILFADKEEGIQFAGYTPLSRITLRNRLIGYGEQDLRQHDVVRSTPYMHGAAMLVRREAIEKAGTMPPSFNQRCSAGSKPINFCISALVTANNVRTDHTIKNSFKYLYRLSKTAVKRGNNKR